MSASKNESGTFENSGESSHENWVSPRELQRKWRKREIFRAISLLLISHLLSFAFLFPEKSSRESIPFPVEEGHLLVQLKARSLLKNISPGKKAVSLFNTEGVFLTHAYIHVADPALLSGEENPWPLEIPHGQLARVLRRGREGLVVTPKEDKKTSSPKVMIHEVDF